MIELRTLVEVALRRFGCHLGAIEENFLQAVIPDGSPVRQVLEVGDTAFLALVQFEEDRLAGYEPVRHLIPGSIYLERFLGLLTEHGAVGDMTLPPVYERPACPPVRSFVTGAVAELDGCEVAVGEVVTHRCVTFHFVVDLITIESSKTLVSITFDFDGGRVVGNPDLHGPPGAAGAVVEVSDAELKAAAGVVLSGVRDEAYRQIEAYAEEHQGERSSARKRLQRQARRSLEGGDQAGQAADIPSGEEHEAIARDWDQRIRHADSQYRAEGAQITLVGATRQLRQFARYEIRRPTWDPAAGGWEILYDLTRGNYLLPACSSCGADAQRLLSGEGLCPHPLCERCAETKPACQHRACKACTHRCAECSATACVGCSSRCGYSDCQSRLCDKHKATCSQCLTCACGQHRQFCRSCRRTFCARCFPSHGWKRADCGHLLGCGSKPGACCVCSKTLCLTCANHCGRCARLVCKEHTARCRDCLAVYCGRHKAACFKCESFICEAHQQFCKSCRRVFCGSCRYNHGPTTADCGHAITCGTKPSACRVCKMTVCYECAIRCQHCGRQTCGEHRVQCLGCRQQVCERCAGVGCETCGANCCKEHSFPCKECGQHLCYEDACWCAVCSRALCGTHAVQCRWCFSTLCTRHGRGYIDGVDVVIDCAVCENESAPPVLFCASCQKLMPHRLMARSNDSFQLICIECLSKCSGCGNWWTEFDFEKCATCGDILCGECLEEHGACS